MLFLSLVNSFWNRKIKKISFLLVLVSFVGIVKVYKVPEMCLT